MDEIIKLEKEITDIMYNSDLSPRDKQIEIKRIERKIEEINNENGW